MNHIPRSFRFLAVLPVLAACIISCAGTPAIRGADGKPLPGSISSLEKIRLGGVDQWILMRGNDVSKPVVLYLHGGPGTALMPLRRYATGELEKSCIMVMWDQRGAGKSYSKKIPRESMTISQLVSDTHELTAYLKKRFSKKKIFLVGSSWGSLLGIRVVQRYPEDYYAFTGVGQVVDNTENERLSWEYTYAQAKKYGNEKAIRELEEAGPPVDGWYKKDRDGDTFPLEGLRLQRKWLMNFGGVLHLDSDEYDGKQKQLKKMMRKAQKIVLFSEEYTLCDQIRSGSGKKFSMESLWPEMRGVNFFRDAPKLDVPVYFFAGRHDYNTPFELVERYCAKLQAPKKKIVWFEKSAHMLIPEEPENFAAEMRKVIAENHD